MFPKHKPKERIMTKAMRWISLKFCTILSYRQATETLNQLLHRNSTNEIKEKTYADFCIRVGKEMEKQANTRAKRVLEQNGFEAESGKRIRKTEEKLEKSSKKFQKFPKIKKSISKWNTLHTESEEQIKVML